MKKYWYLCFFFFFIAFILFLGSYICPDFMFLQSYHPNFDSLDFISGTYAISIAWCLSFSLFLFAFLVWDFFKSKFSGKEPDKIKKFEV